MNAYPFRYRRSKVVIAGTALAALVQPAFPSVSVAVRPNLGKARPGHVVTTQTHLPAATTAVTSTAAFTGMVRAGRLPRRAGTSVFSRSALLPVTAPSAAQVRPDVAPAALAPRKAAPHPVQARTWAADPQARPRSPVIVKAGMRRLAALVAFTRCATPPEAVESRQSSTPRAVRPTPRRAPTGSAVTARTRLIDGTLGLSPTTPTLVRAARRSALPGRMRAALARGAEPTIHQTPPTEAVVAAPVRTPRRAGSVATARTAQPPSPPTTLSVLVRARRGPTPPARPATCLHGLVFTVQPPPLTQPVRASQRAARNAPAVVAIHPAPVPIVGLRPAVVHPATAPRRAGRMWLLASFTGPAPPPRPLVVRKGQRASLSAPRGVVGHSIAVRQVGPPQSFLMRPGRLPRRPGTIETEQTWIPTPAAHGPVPQVHAGAAGRWPKRPAPQPIVAASPISWAVTGLAPDLPAAVIAWLRLNRAIVSGFGETLTATPPVYKLFGDWNSTKSPMPYLVYQEVYEGPGNYQSANAQGVVYRFPTGQFQVSIFTAGKRQGRILAEMVAAALSDAPLAFADGVLLELRLDSMHAMPDGDIGPGGVVTAYHVALTFLYRVQRSLTFTT